MALYEHGHQWLWCLPVALFYTGADVNVWWCVTHGHPSKQCPAYLSTNIVLTAGYATHVWNYIMSSRRKIHDPYISLKKHLTLYQKVLHANESAGSYIYIYSVCNITYMEEKDRSVN